MGPYPKLMIAALLQVALGGYQHVFWLLAATLVAAGVGVLATRAEGLRRAG